MTAEQTAQMERFLPYVRYVAAAGQVVSVVVIMLVVSGLMFTVFNAVLGGDGTFKQVFSVVVHSGFVIAAQQFVVLPLDYVRESMTSPTSLSVFAPFLEETSFAARFLGALDLSLMWWIVNLSIGLGRPIQATDGPDCHEHVRHLPRHRPRDCRWRAVRAVRSLALCFTVSATYRPPTPLFTTGP